MKTIGIRLAFLGCLLSAALLGGMAHTTPPKEKKHLELESLTIKAPGSKANIHMLGQEHGAAIWVSGEHGRLVSIVADEGMAYVGVHAGDGNGCPVAFAVHKDGKSTIQIASGDKVKIIDVDDLLKIMK